MPKAVWLASYPKSGNTWMRTFLWAIQNKGPINLNRLNTGGIYSGKNVLENTLDANPDYFHPHEIEVLQRKAYYHTFEVENDQKIIKIHDAYTYSKWDGQPLIPLNPDHLVIYIVRNPLDVVPSFANHGSTDFETVINKQINNPNGGLILKAVWSTQFHQPMGSWSMHVESWLSQKIAPVLLVRYEDMKHHTFDVFKNVIQAMELSYSDDEIRHAIERTSFDVIKKLEEQQGFREKPNPNRKFFLHGKVGRGKEVLSPDQIQRIRNTHEKIMKQLNYW